MLSGHFCCCWPACNQNARTMYRIFVCLIVAHCVFAEVVTNANLRGNAASAGKKSAADAAGNEAVHNQHENMKKHENALYEVIKQIHQKGLQKGTKVAKDSVLSVPDVSYQNYMVMRQRLNKDCTGPVSTLIARNVGCMSHGPTSSVQIICTSSSSFEEYYYYSSTNCTGTVDSYNSEQMSQTCFDGQGMQCLSHNDVPEFAEKEGLHTYKFRDQGSCSTYASSVLGFWPDYNDDGVLFDDYFPLYDDNSGNFDDDSTACCLPSEINSGMALEDTCPYPVCEFNGEGDGGGGNTPTRRQLGAKAAKAPAAAAPVAKSAAKAPASTFVRPAEWWKSKAKTAYVKNAMKMQTIPTDAYFREYSLSQQRSNVCVFDEKYKLWVKTSCHGKNDLLVYHVYADDQCRALIKRVEHTLSEAIPHYGACVPSAKGDNRVALTICHDKDGVTPPNGYYGEAS